jgi:hypothetical protein
VYLYMYAVLCITGPFETAGPCDLVSFHSISINQSISQHTWMITSVLTRGQCTMIFWMGLITRRMWYVSKSNAAAAVFVSSGSQTSTGHCS